MSYFAGGAAAFVAAGLTLLGLRPFLRRRALDVPTARSSHAMPVPRGGGIGVVLGALTGAAVLPSAEPVVLFGLVAMGLVGLAEDLTGVSIRVRLVCQVGVAVAVVAFLAADGLGPGFLLPAAVVGLVAWCNAFNFMDGIDGISGLTAIVVLGWYAVLAAGADTEAALVTAVVLAGAVAGFMPWNFPRARLFLGDAGSYALGMALPVLGLVLVAEGADRWSVLAPLLVYAADVAWTLARRLRRGEAWHEAHRDHVYQALSLRLGHPATALLVAALTAVVCLLARVLDGEPTLLGAAWALLLTSYLTLGQVGRPRRAGAVG